MLLELKCSPIELSLCYVTQYVDYYASYSQCIALYNETLLDFLYLKSRQSRSRGRSRAVTLNDLRTCVIVQSRLKEIQEYAFLMQFACFRHNVRRITMILIFFHFWFDLNLTTNYLSFTIYSI